MTKKLLKSLIYGEFDTLLCKVEDDLGIKPIELTDQEQEDADELINNLAEFILKLYNKHS